MDEVIENGKLTMENGIKGRKLSITRQDGFTLAELLVSIGLIVLFTAILMPSLSGFGRRNELAQTAQFVQTKILEAKSFALAPRASATLPIAAYTFRAPVTSTLSGCSGTGADYYTILEQAEDSFLTVVSCEKLPSNIRFTGNQQDVTFSVVNQGAVTQPSPPAEITFTIEHTRLTSPNRRDIVVRKETGQVTIGSLY